MLRLSATYIVPVGSLVTLDSRVLHISGDDGEELATAFIRFQSYYESAIFKGTSFSLQDYQDWYIETFGEFTYTTDFIGFNAPSNIFWRGETAFAPLSSIEKELMTLLDKALSDFGGFGYIIGAQDEIVTNHELAHAFYYLDSTYHTQIRREVLQHKEEWVPLVKELTNRQYDASVIVDEIQAYIIAGEAEHLIPSSNTTKKIISIFKERMKRVHRYELH